MAIKPIAQANIDICRFMVDNLCDLFYFLMGVRKDKDFFIFAGYFHLYLIQETKVRIFSCCVVDPI